MKAVSVTLYSFCFLFFRGVSLPFSLFPSPFRCSTEPDRISGVFILNLFPASGSPPSTLLLFHLSFQEICYHYSNLYTTLSNMKCLLLWALFPLVLLHLFLSYIFFLRVPVDAYRKKNGICAFHKTLLIVQIRSTHNMHINFKHVWKRMKELCTVSVLSICLCILCLWVLVRFAEFLNFLCSVCNTPGHQKTNKRMLVVLYDAVFELFPISLSHVRWM